MNAVTTNDPSNWRAPTGQVTSCELHHGVDAVSGLIGNRGEELAAEPAAGQRQHQSACHRADEVVEVDLGVAKLKTDKDDGGAQAHAQALLQAVACGGAGEGGAE